MGGYWPERSLQAERMDLEAIDEATAASILGALEKVNVWLGGVRATLYHVERFARLWKPGQSVRFIDWGTGGADLPRALVRWGRKRGYHFKVVGVDSNPSVIAYAQKACRDYPEIRLTQTDFSDFPSQTTEPFDYAISSLSLHHLKDAEIVALLQKSDRLVRRGIIMNDLKRSLRAWIWIWLLTRIGRAHPIVQNDAPLSVRRAFRPAELKALAESAGLSYLTVTTHFGYRLTLSGEKPHPESATRGPLPVGEGTA
jgi:2-polyprenyl-3-methyl-5-hydroxy-6-metoxy-1,4-benzoquinol methylase